MSDDVERVDGGKKERKKERRDERKERGETRAEMIRRKREEER